MTNADAPNRDRALARREWVVILVLTLVAACLRFWAFGRIGLTHFDEGIYAQAGLWAFATRGLAGLDPQLIAYAPPGFPILIGLVNSVLGVSDASAILVSVVFGVMTVPLVGWLGRRTFGTGAGASAAAFAALSIAHIAYSRKALNDVPFLLTWLAALGLGSRFLEQPRFGRALAFGLATGIAMNFKYNGWIPGAVVGLAAVFGLVRKEGRDPWVVARTFGLGALGLVVAGACYWPWYAFVETQPGGYAALVRHHASYLGGFHSWRNFGTIQLAQAVALSGGAVWMMIVWAVASTCHGLASGLPRVRAGEARRDALRFSMGLLLGGAAIALIPDLGWWLGLVWVPWLAIDPAPASRILAAWWLILSVMTPFYHPYARLALPLHAAGWLILSGAVVSYGSNWITNPLSSIRATMTRPIVLIETAVLLICVLDIRLQWAERKPCAFPVRAFFEPTDDVRRSIAEVEDVASRSGESWERLRLLGRRPFFFELALQGRIPIQLVDGVKRLTRGPILAAERALVDEIESEQGLPAISTAPEVLRFWTPYRTWSTRLDPVTLLDVNPDAAFEVYRERKAPLVLLRPRANSDPIPPTPELLDAPP